MADQRRPDERIVITDEQELAIGARVSQFLGARHEMPQRALSTRNYDRTAEKQRPIPQRNYALGKSRIDDRKQVSVAESS